MSTIRACPGAGSAFCQMSDEWVTNCGVRPVCGADKLVPNSLALLFKTWRLSPWIVTATLVHAFECPCC